MTKNSFFAIFTLMYLFYGQHALCMDPKITLGKKLFAMSMAARNAAKQPKSLYQCCNVQAFSGADKYVKNLLAEQIVGNGGWWYKKAEREATEYPMNVALHPEASMAVVVYKKFSVLEPDKACLWDFESNKVIPLPGNHVLSAAFNAQGTMIALGTMLDTVLLVDLLGNLKHTFQTRQWFKEIAFNSHGTLLTNGSRVIDLVSKNMTEYNLDAEITAVAFHPTCKTLFGVGILKGSQNAKVYLLDSQRDRFTVLRHPAPVHVDKIVFSPEADRVVTVCRSRILREWNARGTELAQTKLGEETIGDIVFHRNGGYVASQASCAVAHTLIKGKDSSVHIRDFTGNDVVQFPCRKYVSKMKFNQRGTALLVACFDEYTVWQQHENPSLEQVLLRVVIDAYSKGCRRSGQDIGITKDTYDALPIVVAKKLNLIESEITEVWSSYSESLRRAIVATIIRRAKKSAYDKEPKKPKV